MGLQEILNRESKGATQSQNLKSGQRKDEFGLDLVTKYLKISDIKRLVKHLQVFTGQLAKSSIQSQLYQIVSFSLAPLPKPRIPSTPPSKISIPILNTNKHPHELTFQNLPLR